MYSHYVFSFSVFLIITIILYILVQYYHYQTLFTEHFENKTNKTKIRVDPLDYYNKYRVDRNYNVVYREDHYVLSVSRKNIKPLIGCIYNLEGLTVGYTTRSGYNIARAIVKGHRMDDSKITYKKIKLVNLGSIDIAIITYPKSRINDLLNDPFLHIFGFGDMDIHRIKAFYPFIKGSLRDIRSISTNDPIAKVENNSSTLILEIQPFIIEKKTKRDEDKEDFKDINDQPGYACYGMPDILNKHLCNSPYDHIGNPKPYFSTWDKKCRNNTDCPFYRVNGDERGGCMKNTGICEMPVGVKKLGFTKYYDKGRYKPFKYPNGDYVFPNDTQERIRNKRNIVAKIDN